MQELAAEPSKQVSLWEGSHFSNEHYNDKTQSMFSMGPSTMEEMIMYLLTLTVPNVTREVKWTEEMVYSIATPTSLEQCPQPMKKYRLELMKKRWIPPHLRDSETCSTARKFLEDAIWTESFDDVSPERGELRECTELEMNAVIHVILTSTNLQFFHGQGGTSSSSIRMSDFTHTFHTYPFYLDTPPTKPGRTWNWKYTQNEGNGLKIAYLGLHGPDANKGRSTQPKPDFALTSTAGFFSSMIGQIDSNVNQEDHWRMLAHTIVLAKLAWWDPDCPCKVIVSSFVRANFIVHLHFTYYDGHKTYITSETYDLSKLGRGLDLLRFNYNLRDHLLYGNVTGLNNAKIMLLELVKDHHLQNLTSNTEASTAKSRANRQGHISSSGGGSSTTHQSGGGNDDGDIVLEDSTLHEEDHGGKLVSALANVASIKEKPWPLAAPGSPRTSSSLTVLPLPRHPNVSAWYSPDGDIIQYRKTLGTNEVKVIEWLQGQDKELLHYFGLPQQTLSSNDCVVGIFAPEGDCLAEMDLTGLGIPIVLQLLECVAILHSLHVAHLDIKLANMVWNRSQSAFKLLDFGVSVISTDHSVLLHEFVGTPGLTAPEVVFTSFNPYSADNYSVGLSISALLYNEAQSEELEFLKCMARQMRDERVEPSVVWQAFLDRFPMYR